MSTATLPLKSPAASGSGRFAGQGALLVLAVLLALLDLGTRSLHELDVARWGTLAREMIRTGDVLVPTRYGEIYANKPPLYLWIVAGTGWINGEITPFLVRLPSALGFVLLVMASARWAMRRTASADAALVAGLLALSTFGLAWLAREGRLDMFGAGLAVAGTAALDAARREGGSRAAWAAGLWLGLAMLVKGPPLLIAPIALLLLDRAPRHFPKPLPFLLPLLGLPLLWLVPALIAGGEPYFRALVVDQMGDRVAGDGNHQQPIHYYLTMLPAQFAPWGLGYLLVAVLGLVPRGRRFLGSTAGLATAGAVSLLVFSAVPTKHVRYLAPVLPLLVVPSAALVARWLDASRATAGWSVHRRAAGVLALVAAGAVVYGGLQSSRDAVPWVVLALALAALGLLAVFARSGTPTVERRRQVALVLLVACLGVGAAGVFRYRFVVRDNEWFNRQLAEQVKPADTVLALAPMTPEDVFHGAPQATYVRDIAEAKAVGTPGVVVVFGRDQDEADVLAAQIGLMQAFGKPTVLVEPRPKHGYRAMRFGP
ncbi:MAG: glycosyltransferase family 39 protein [Planctomycetota bacterium]